jgi:hypothetical protein
LPLAIDTDVTVVPPEVNENTAVPTLFELSATDSADAGVVGFPN